MKHYNQWWTCDDGRNEQIVHENTSIKWNGLTLMQRVAYKLKQAKALASKITRKKARI
jgi:hypothetical protein